ncbi:hypothetical protein F5148DRAFT_50024 [Russula earlei]|uniref:Uncharacterized protein n=1 Tax=Russula earlei TaxID=71964 RepID=A0ACC0U887_9AGAM|nr:hypothetical protein F5148DRAFT_50024 [Russula earlei]
MSARQPFLPSRPASRTVNPSEETGATPTNVAPAVLNKTSDNNHLEVGVTGSIRALNISGLRKSSRTPNLSAIVNPGTLHNQIQNQGLSGGTHSRSDTKSSATRIYAPLPSTPPAVLPQPQCPVFGLPTPEFKTPLLPFSKSFDETAAGRGSVEAITRSPASNSDGAALNLFRPMSCHPQDEIGAQGRRPTSHQSFFGSARLSFDSVSSHLDDSGYYSSVSEQNDNEGDQPIPVNRSNAVCPSAGGDDVQGPRNVNDFDANLPHPTKRIPTSFP